MFVLTFKSTLRITYAEAFVLETSFIEDKGQFCAGDTFVFCSFVGRGERVVNVID